jgi:hypothetical protein
VCIEGKTNIV